MSLAIGFQTSTLFGKSSLEALGSFKSLSVRTKALYPLVAPNWRTCPDLHSCKKRFCHNSKQQTIGTISRYGASKQHPKSRAPTCSCNKVHRLHSHETEAPPENSKGQDRQNNNAMAQIEAVGGVVALGKFDALHVGHRALAAAAAQMGMPFMLSFSGMAQILGWEPRLPLVAGCERRRVMSLWAEQCGGKVAQEVSLQFASVRSLSPAAFVDLLADELRVKGVVAGGNYRFGFKASGDASDLVHLCRQRGLMVHIVDPVLDDASSSSPEDSESQQGYLSGGTEMGQVSSTRVRRALQDGDVARVAALLGRRYRLTAGLEEASVSFVAASSTEGDGAGFSTSSSEPSASENGPSSLSRTERIPSLQIPCSGVQSQLPKAGSYPCSVYVHNHSHVSQVGCLESLWGEGVVHIGDGGIEVVLQNTDQDLDLSPWTCVSLQL
eukprot:jgi/Mesen1/6993/ME000365S06131